MTSWLGVGLLGGFVGLDATSFPQAMISRPLVAGTLAGAVLGRPLDGVAVGFVMEAFALIILPVGAVRYPESGTATVAATAAYVATTPPGLVAGSLALAVVFALFWERLAGESVVLLRRGNGRILGRRGGVAARQLERRHLAAMTFDFLRGVVVTSLGALLAWGVLAVLDGYWGLPADLTLVVLATLVASMVGTAVPLFGGLRTRALALAVGVGVGIAVGIAL
ncbi:MAG: PTS sugar transporter subunit IIC [Gemmatimonadota bacterium]|jgi:mannose/fructose/N-acetylgalactosamine-specific phosphotransferase system component IIC